jgi:hypothetical protein
MAILSGLIGFFGWKWLIVIPLLYLFAYIGAHNPQCRLLHASKNGMESTANKLLAKAKELAQQGK